MEFGNRKFHGDFLSCSDFEELLSDYLERMLDANTHRLMAEHSLKCPVCHALLNDVLISLEACQTLPVPKVSLAKLEAKILSATVSETSMSCEEFEESLTDYLDGFLPAPLFHRWERHAALCKKCSDLPGMVVRSIALCYNYKMQELPIPDGLHEKIMQATVGELVKAKELIKPKSLKNNNLKGLLVKLSWLIRTTLTVKLPQLAPVATMMIFAMFVLSQVAKGNLGSFYRKSFELAGKTYKQGASIVIGESETERMKNKNKEE